MGSRASCWVERVPNLRTFDRPQRLISRLENIQTRQGGRVWPNASACRADHRRFKSGPWLGVRAAICLPDVSPVPTVTGRIFHAWRAIHLHLNTPRAFVSRCFCLCRRYDEISDCGSPWHPCLSALKKSITGGRLSRPRRPNCGCSWVRAEKTMICGPVRRV